MEAKLLPIYFDAIKNGKKLYEGRINDEKRKKWIEGSLIRLVNTETQEIMNAKIVSRSEFASFEDAFKDIPVEQMLPGVETVDEAVKIYRSFPTYSEGEKEFGVVVFKFEV